MNTINIFMNETLGCLDTGKLKASDADRMMITVNAGRQGPTNPANNLIRYQFMEYIIRCSTEKFFASGQVANELEAIQKFLNDYFIPSCKNYDQHAWRLK